MGYYKEYEDCLEYIDSYWNKTIHKSSRKKIPFPKIKIPHSYLVPNKNKFNSIFYWDTFFMFKGLIGTKHAWIMKEMVNNFIYLFNKYGIIPNSNLHGLTNRSHPPFLTSMIMDTFNSFSQKKKRWLIKDFTYQIKSLKRKIWLKKAIKVARKEYELVWLDPDGFYNHSVKGFKLARYGDGDIGYSHSSELESGWDFTSRFYNRCSDFLPIDLNIYLYKYEIDFAATSRLFKEFKNEEFWVNKARIRKTEINKYMWSKEEGFFFDYNCQQKKQSSFLSLAGFTPLWAGIATKEQAERMVKKLKKFQSPYGLFITDKESLPKPIDGSKIDKPFHPAIKEIIEPKQWDYPNIWSPLEYLTVIGLLRYGYLDEAVGIMKNSIAAHAKLFRKYGTFFEKINGITGDKTNNFHYENQHGFGWTNAVFYRYIKILDEINNNSQIIEDDINKDEVNILNHINIY